jgi:hypothetical protein
MFVFRQTLEKQSVMSSYNISEANVSALENSLAIVADSDMSSLDSEAIAELFRMSVTVNALRLAEIQQLMADNAEHSERQRQRWLDILADARQKFDNEAAVQLREHNRKERELLEQIERLTASDDSETEDLIALMSDGTRTFTESEN